MSVSSIKLAFEVGGGEDESLLYVGAVGQYVQERLDPIIKCKFRPYGMDAYTPLDPMKPNRYFPGLAPGFFISDLILGYWNEKMVGWIKCDIYEERGEPAITQTLWIDKDSFTYYLPVPRVGRRRRF